MKTKNTILVVLNTITFIAMLFVNYASNTYFFSPVNVGDISHKYDTLFAPANYAFIIWAVIFLFCSGFVIYQWTLLKNDPQQYIKRTGLWFAISNIVNALWVYYWVNEQLRTSVILILILLLCLIILTLKLKLELYDEPVRTIFFVWWPIAIYLGWMMVATIACLAAALVAANWDGLGLADSVWAIMMMIIAMLLYIFLIQKRNLRESAAVGVWAFIAIAVRQWNNHSGVAITASAVAAILLFAIMYHWYKNRKYSVGLKIKRNEWKQ